MGRKIKFRAWVPFEDSETGDVTMHMLTDEDMADYHYEDVVNPIAPGIAMQFTGALDKDGKEIYEGDIVTRMCLDPNCDLTHTGIVVFSDKWGTWMIDEGDQERTEIGDYMAPLMWGSPADNVVIPLEVLGNVYQNPELVHHHEEHAEAAG